jgi:hypothetical protein
MGKLLQHLKTVRKHRRYVRQMCFKMGIPWRGIVHDLSKYSLKELSICKYYGGIKSPHALCRDELGYSPSWIYHYHKNKHHWQFWLDIEDWPNKVYPIKMPYKYVIEMFCDFIGAGKAYNPGKWNESMPWDYYEKACKGKRLMHKSSEYLLTKLLWILKEKGLDIFLDWYKKTKKWLKDQYELPGNMLELLDSTLGDMI